MDFHGLLMILWVFWPVLWFFDGFNVTVMFDALRVDPSPLAHPAETLRRRSPGTAATCEVLPPWRCRQGRRSEDGWTRRWVGEKGRKGKSEEVNYEENLGKKKRLCIAKR